MIDNVKLETATEAFVKDKSKENFVSVMELLEKAVVYLPSMVPENLDEKTAADMKAGRPVKLPKEAKIMPCLLKKENGEQVLPVFSSQKHIPKEKRSPALLGMPFAACASLAMAHKEAIEAAALNPFTQNIIIPKQVLEVALKRSQMQQTKTVQLTRQQFHELAHRRAAYEILPAFLFEKKEEGVEKMKADEAKGLLSIYASIYPKEVGMPYVEDDFSFMSLNVTETMQITRIDMPEKNMAAGLCCRIYVVWKRDTQELEYYTIEKAEGGNEIGRVYADRRHETVKRAPDNGAEIETIMELAGA